MSTTTFADQVYSHIFNQLLRRELRPGDLLDRKQIAQELDVSLIPVSDAVQRLTHEGFLTTRRRQGTFVRTPDIEDVRGELLLREALECQCARLYCGETLQQEKRKLQPLAKAADQEADTGRQHWVAEFAFHQALVALTECKALIQCFERVVNLSMFYQKAVINPTQSITCAPHAKLLDDLCQADADEAEARIRQHVRAGNEALFE